MFQPTMWSSQRLDTLKVEHTIIKNTEIFHDQYKEVITFM